MGGFLGLGHSSSKTDRGNQLAGINANWNVFNAGMPFASESTEAGKTNISSGMGTLDQVKKFWTDILSGNRTSTAMAAAPTVNAAVAGADAASRQQGEMGTARGGGVNAVNQQQQTNLATDVNNAIFGARPVAAQQAGEVAKTESQVGLNRLQQALAALGLSESAAKELIDSSIQSRQVSYEQSPARGPEYLLGKAMALALFGA